IWDAVTGKEITILRHKEEVSDAAFSPDGTAIVTASRWDSTARIWDAAPGKEITILHVESAGAAAFSPDASRIVSASGFNFKDDFMEDRYASDNIARIWDA